MPGGRCRASIVLAEYVLDRVLGGVPALFRAMADGDAGFLRAVLDAAALLRLRGRAERRQRGTGEHDAADRLAVHAGHLVSHGTPGRFYGSRLKPLLHRSRHCRSGFSRDSAHHASMRLAPASRPDFRLASMNSSRSPSSTFCVSERSTPVRRSLMRLWSST